MITPGKAGSKSVRILMGEVVMSASAKTTDEQLAEVARQIYATYGNNIQRYFEAILSQDSPPEPRDCIDQESARRILKSE